MGGVKAYFSGVEGEQHFKAAMDSGCEHVLMSYLYVRKRGMDLIKKRKKQYPHIKFFLDSGAHTFMDKWREAPYNVWTVADYEKYLVEYIEYIKANKEYLEVAVELDIDWSISAALCGGGLAVGGSEEYVKNHTEKGVAVIKEWQEKYFRPLERDYGIPIIYVWHAPFKMEGFEDFCKNFSYVGIPGELSKERDFNNFLTIAKRYTTRLHGFAASLEYDSLLMVKDKNGVISQVKIGDLFKRCRVAETGAIDEYFGELPEHMETWSLDDNLKSVFAPIRRVIKHTLNKRLYKITLRGGKTVVGTEDHSFFSLSRTGDLVLVKPSELSVGDYMVSSLGFIPSDKGEIQDVLEAEFFGVWFGDGCVTGNVSNRELSILVSKQHQPEIRDVCERYCSARGVRWAVSSGSIDGRTYAPSLAKKISSLMGRTGEFKFIGSAILSSPLQLQAAFLRGYFSADGTAKGRNMVVSLSCFSRNVLATVQIMLENWDIRSSITYDGVSGKGRVTWKLNISDSISLKNFRDNIGFLQGDQNENILAKIKDKPIAGVHRGLPVHLLRETGRLYRRDREELASRPVYAKDKRRAEIPENFVPKLLERECELLEISSIECVSSGKPVEVYDLEVPKLERFFANGILAHNTKMIDYRDVPWYSIDSSVTGDSLILVRENGVTKQIRIDELYAKGKVEDGRVGYESFSALQGTECWTVSDDLKERWGVVRGVVKHKVRKNIYTVSTANGFRFKGTGDHSIFSLTKQGELVEVMPASLKVGDFVVIQRTSPKGSDHIRCRRFLSRSSRGLPVELIEDGIVRLRNGRTRKVSRRDKHVSPEVSNFHARIREMDCWVSRVTEVSCENKGVVDVYDLDVPEFHRFYADGVLAHNTSWKSSEIYGTLIDWDERTQSLKYIEDKGRRVEYRHKFEKLGLDAEAIINDTNYKEITKYALWSFASMEKFFAKKFSFRTYYYELRLPQPKQIETGAISTALILEHWRKINPKEVFPEHASEKSAARIRSMCLSIAAVQYRETQYLKGGGFGAKFLSCYLEKFITAESGIVDLDSLQKELSMLLCPRNLPPIPRCEEEDFFPSNNMAKARLIEDDDDDLDFEDNDMGLFFETTLGDDLNEY